MNHSKYLRFASQITQLLSEYSIEDLRAFLSAARHGFPSMMPVIEACIKMVDYSPQRGTPPRHDGDVVGQHRSSSLPGLFFSAKAFPRNNHLGEFATKLVPSFPLMRFDKMSRKKIVRKIMACLDALPRNHRRDVEGKMIKIITSLESAQAEGNEDRFFSTWEAVIKRL